MQIELADDDASLGHGSLKLDPYLNPEDTVENFPLSFLSCLRRDKAVVILNRDSFVVQRVSTLSD